MKMLYFRLSLATLLFVSVIMVNSACSDDEGSSNPVIKSFSPSSGDPGTTVTISGSNFLISTSGNQVTFNGTPATITVASTVELTVIVPVGATTGPISVTANGKTATSANSFTVQ